MAEGIKPIRRVVTGEDKDGRSCVIYDGPAPSVSANQFKKGTGMTDIWLWDKNPVPISGTKDDGDVPFHFEPPDRRESPFLRFDARYSTRHGKNAQQNL